MASPGLLGGVGIGSTILGSILGGVGAERAGAAQAQMYTYQAGIANLNKQIAEQNANYAYQQGELTAERYGLGARQQAGHIVAAQAASGLDVRGGSAQEVQESQHLVSKMDMNTIRMNAAKTAYDYQTQSLQFGLQSQLDLMGARDVRKAADIGMMTSLVGGAASVADKWMRAGQVGMFGGGDAVGLGA